MIHSNTSFGKLKEVIVGRELEINSRIIDITFRLFYKENLKDELFQTDDVYKINNDVLIQRNAELDQFANILEEFGITVYRPRRANTLVKIQTPYFKSECSSASNVRDITLVYNNKLIEMPNSIRNRYFENMLLYDVFNHAYDNGNGGQWIKSPNVFLTESTIDLNDWHQDRDFQNIPANMQMGIDGAQFLRIGKDVIVNVATYNHKLGFNWLKSFFPDTAFHEIKIVDGHIDGTLLCLRPGVFLANPHYIEVIRKQLPDKFNSWKFIVPKLSAYNDNIKQLANRNIQLASSEGMDVNVLSIDENTVCVNKRAVNVIAALEKEHFTVVPIELNNCELFAGSIHCSTLDIVRDDEYIDYTK